MKKSKIFSLLIGVMLIGLSSISVSADEPLNYYYEENTYMVNTGKDNGYSEIVDIDKNDPHYGWQLGDLNITGFTADVIDSDGNRVFLKNVGDKIQLNYLLKQNIDALNDDEMLKISDDTNTYDKYFGIKPTDFGRGCLIIRYTDWQGKSSEPQIYTNFLSAKVSEGANTQVELFEEGDYEVALDYEIAKSSIDVFGWQPIKSYTNYRVFFKFSVRNGNCMVYPCDVQTKSELTNTSMTENGFYLDLARSRYLDIMIKKEMMASGANGLTEDIRFNRPAKDGDEYTEEGIYTITVKNHYTETTTEKKIYVGNNPVMRAYVMTGLPIEEINRRVEQGATIADDGTIIDSESPITTNEAVGVLSTSVTEKEQKTNLPLIIGIVIIAVGLVGFGVFIFLKRRAKK